MRTTKIFNYIDISTLYSRTVVSVHLIVLGCNCALDYSITLAVVVACVKTRVVLLVVMVLWTCCPHSSQSQR